MKKLFLSAGHSNKIGRDRGAVGNGLIEGEVTAEFRQLLSIELQKLGIKPFSDGDNTILQDTLNFARKLIDKNTLSIEFHTNSFSNNTATGCEVLVSNTNSIEEFDLADKISKQIASTLRIVNRGVKKESQSKRGRLGWFTLSGQRILIELFFISNPADCENYQFYKFELAKILALVIREHLKK
jgi:N-acetylmuramoyl-L-alanine amidase